MVTKSSIKPGTRVRLISMNDPYTKIPEGTEGTVRLVDIIACRKLASL